jgi:glycosyltransferase involved in cell wall biosynthesis
MLRVIISTEDLKPDKGYMEYYLARELAQMGHNISVVCFGKKPWSARKFFVNSFEVQEIPYFARIGGYHLPSLYGVFVLLRLLKRKQPHVIHCQPLFSPLSLLLTFLTLGQKPDVVGSVFTGVFQLKTEFSRLLLSITRLVMKHYSAKRVSFVFALNLSVASRLNELFGVPSNSIIVIPLGADSNLFAPNPSSRLAARTALSLSKEDFVVIYSGRISRPKKIHLLIEAFAKLDNRSGSSKLLIVGSGDVSYERELREMCRSMNLSNVVVFVKSVHRKRLPQFYAASDVAVWPGVPSISIMEAAAMGLPVIMEQSLLTTHLVASEIGFSVRPNNVSDLKRILQKLINNEQFRLKIGKHARKMVLKNYEWSRIAREYEKVYLRASQNITGKNSQVK